MKTVLLTAVGSASAHAAHASLAAAGYRVIGCDIYPKSWNVNSGEMTAFFQVPLATDTEAYVEALQDIVCRENVGSIVPLTDVEVDALCTSATLSCFQPSGSPDLLPPDLCQHKSLSALLSSCQ